MSDVFFKKATRSQIIANPAILAEFLENIKLYDKLSKGDFVGIKIHFGEKGNKSFINPKIFRSFVSKLKKIKIRPFFFDTNTLYRGQRTNAVDHINLAASHGFNSIGIPILIADGLKGNNFVEVEIDKKHYKKCFVSALWKDIDFIISASHFTMHMLTGFGATIKNLGMGIASRRGKLAQHCEISPSINKDTCLACGLCAKTCPVEAIEKGSSYYTIINGRCIGCAQCISVCPNGSVKINWSESYTLMQEKMTEYAYAVTYKKRCAYINFCIYITKECDCMNKENDGCVQDLGILSSYDPVAVDKASIDLLIQREGKDIVKDAHPKVDYNRQLTYAEEIGLGYTHYDLIEL